MLTLAGRHAVRSVHPITLRRMADGSLNRTRSRGRFPETCRERDSRRGGSLPPEACPRFSPRRRKTASRWRCRTRPKATTRSTSRCSDATSWRASPPWHKCNCNSCRLNQRRFRDRGQCGSDRVKSPVHTEPSPPLVGGVSRWAWPLADGLGFSADGRSLACDGA